MCICVCVCVLSIQLPPVSFGHKWQQESSRQTSDHDGWTWCIANDCSSSWNIFYRVQMLKLHAKSVYVSLFKVYSNVFNNAQEKSEVSVSSIQTYPSENVPLLVN